MSTIATGQNEKDRVIGRPGEGVKALRCSLSRFPSLPLRSPKAKMSKSVYEHLHWPGFGCFEGHLILKEQLNVDTLRSTYFGKMDNPYWILLPSTTQSPIDLYLSLQLPEFGFHQFHLCVQHFFLSQKHFYVIGFGVSE